MTKTPCSKAHPAAKAVLAALSLFGQALAVSADGNPPIEWTGTYSFFSDNSPTFPGSPWVFSKLDGADYPDATMLVAALSLPDDGTTGVDVLEQAQALFTADCNATTLAVGACAKVTFGGAATSLEFDKASFVGSGRYAFFTEHRPEEFDAETIGGLAPDSSEVVGDGHTHEHTHAADGDAHSHGHDGDGHDNDDHAHGDDDAATDDHVHGDGTGSDDDTGHAHDSGAEIDTGDHTHTTEIHPYEWAGSYKLPAGSHTWTLSKRAGKTSYPDASMRIFIIALEYDHDEVDGGNHSLHSADENADALTAAETEATAMFGSESATSKKNGDVVRPAAVMQRIDFNNDNAVTTLTIRIEDDGYYGIFTEHMPWEFDADSITVNGNAVAASVAHDFSSEHNGHTHTNEAANEAPGGDSGASAGSVVARIITAVAGVVAASFFQL